MLHSNTSTVTFLEKTHLPSYEPPLTWTFSNQSPLDNFLWGYLKDRIYANDLQTIDALKHYIRTEIRIPHELLHRVITDLNVRVVTATQWFPLWFKYLRTHRFTKPEIFELSSVVDNWEFTTRIRNHYKNARALKKTEGYRVVARWLVDNLYRKPGSDGSVAYMWERAARLST